MRILDLILEFQFEELAQALFEKTGDGKNATVVAWAKKLDMTYEELHKVWDKSKKIAKSDTDYGLIMTIFKRQVTSLKGVTKKQLKDGGDAKFNYKVRTQQTIDQLLDDKPAPKSTNRVEVKKAAVKLKKISQEIKDIKSRPNNTPTRKARNKKDLAAAIAKRKEIKDSLN
jgi:hypothetical protein